MSLVRSNSWCSANGPVGSWLHDIVIGDLRSSPSQIAFLQIPVESPIG